MPTTGSTDDLRVLGDVDTSLSRSLSLSPPLSITTVPLPPAPPCDADIEKRAASMSNADCNKALSSPVEASTAKLAPTSPAPSEGSVDTSPSVSHIASAADSLPCHGTNIINMEQETPSAASPPPSTPFGDSGDTDYPAKLTFKGVTVTLESSKVWNDFHKVGTEMILTRPGRHMFPYCRYRVTGLDPNRKYSMVLSIPPADTYKYRWCGQKFEVSGPAEHSSQGLIRAFAHHYSPSTGAEWMNMLISFKKLKLTNNGSDQEGNIILHSLHRYIPRLHVIPVPESVLPTADQPVVMGPESMTFTFPQTEFMTVTTYQNFRITQMKIRYNPFAKSFREDGHNPRLNRIVKREVEFVNVETAGASATAEKEPEPSVTEEPEPEQHIVLKPIMSPFSPDHSAYVTCRGKHALGNLVLAQTPTEELKRRESDCPINLTPPMKLCITVNSRAKFRPSSTPRLLNKYKKKRKFRSWRCTPRKEWSVEASPATPAPPPVSIQPELDDVEGLLFVSFTSKAALDSHLGEQPVIETSSQRTSSEPTVQLQQTVETGSVESEDEKLLLLEAQLMQDLQVLKHRQVIHPVLQEVGLKLITLDPSQPVDLQYLGVELPQSPTSSTDETGGSSFISRTGKTSDMTKIKGWRNKFSSENLPHGDANLSEGLGSKNLSAFCSNMLDEYLETEEQQISERAEAFSTQPQGAVAYELPAKSSSYVKTLDSALKQRSAPPATVSSKPCPLSYKLVDSEPPSPASPTPSASPALSEESLTPLPSPGPAQSNTVANRLSKYLPLPNPKPVSVTRGSQLCLTMNLSKPQLKLYEMEVEAWNSGMKPTQLAPDRLKVALSALMTKWSHLNEMFKVPQFRRGPAPPCGKAFCRLGCVCQSLCRSQFRDKAPYHCRRPECMFDCTCFRQKISRHLIMESSTSSSYTIKNPEKLWVKNIIDSDRDPLLVPETNSPDAAVLPKAPKLNTAPVPKIREEDKDPVYKFLESRLTCARVREFNCKNHHLETLEDLTASAAAAAAAAPKSTPAAAAAAAAPKSTPPAAAAATAAPKSTPATVAPPPPAATLKLKVPSLSTAPTGSTKPGETTARPTHNVFVLKKKSETASAQVNKRTRTLIEIQSCCKWAKDDRKMVLEALCVNMNRNRLCRPFCVGQYRIKPVAKIVAQKPSETVITYKIRISLKSNGAGSGADNDCSDGENNPRVEKAPEEKRGDGERHFPIGVTPFLSRIQPAGVLKAHTACSRNNTPGIVQVNGKSYSHARLMLGRMGSLHPANRVAAFVTGRLGGTSNLYKKHTSNPDPKAPCPSTAAPVPSSQKQTGLPPLKMPEQLAALIKKPSPSQSMPPPPPKPARDSPFQSSTPVALTVSPSLKTPSFLGKKGTYSFRLCPPDNDSCKLPGVSLPGGFTLIQLSKPDLDSTPQSQKLTHIQDKRSTNADRLAQIFGYTLKSNKNDNCKLTTVNNRPIEISDDSESEDSSFSEEDGEVDVDDELSVDVESVFAIEQHQMVNRLRVAAGLPETPKWRPLKKPRSVDTEGHDRNYIRMCSERQRRIEHKELFDNLQTVLDRGHGTQTPKLHLLTMATKEIKALKERSKYLEEKKKLLTKIQNGYVKEISLMSGQSKETILEKLRDVCEKQKRKEKMMSDSSYSELLQSNAAMVQAFSTKSKPESTPLLAPIIKPEPSSPPKEPTIEESPEMEETDDDGDDEEEEDYNDNDDDESDPKPNATEQIQATAKSFVQQLLSKLKPIIHNAKSCHQMAKARREQAERQKSAEESASSAPPAPSVKKPQTLSLPLVRTKDGRIILPSSVKPAAQTFYTLKLVNSSQGQDGAHRPTVLLQPLDPAAVKQQNLNKPGSVSDPQSSLPTLAAPQSMVFKSPLASIGYLNKSVLNQSATFPTTSTTSPVVVNSNQLPAAVPKTFRSPAFSLSPSAAPPTKRGRGRPRKYPLPDGTPPVVAPNALVKKDPDFAPSFVSQVNKRPAVRLNPRFLPVKRGRGRPPKNPSQYLDPYSRRIKEEDEEWDITFNTSNVKGTRHLTRGSLGKDFPSAKKRSWVDLEDDLDVDVD